MGVSIIIPTAGRGEQLKRTLESICSLAGDPEDYEILVIENGARGEAEQLARQAAGRNRRIRYIYEPVPGLLAGRHRGFHESEGEICAFIDDDVRLDRQWLLAIQDAFRDPAVSLASGPSSPLFEAQPPDWLEVFYDENDKGRFCLCLSLNDRGNEIKRVEACYIFGLNYVIRRGALLEHGGFHPHCVPKSLQRFQGDGETGLNMSLRRAGAVALYHPGIRVQHEISRQRLTLHYLEQRFFYEGVSVSFTQNPRWRHSPRKRWKQGRHSGGEIKVVVESKQERSARTCQGPGASKLRCRLSIPSDGCPQ